MITVSSVKGLLLPGARLLGRDRLREGRLSRSAAAAPTSSESRRCDTVWPIFLGLSVLLHVWLFLCNRPVLLELDSNAAQSEALGRTVVVDLVPQNGARTSSGIAAASQSPETATAVPVPPAPPAVAAPSLEASSISGRAASDVPLTSRVDGTANQNRYFPAHSLSRQPELVREPPPNLEILDDVQSGHLLVRLLIDRFGKVNAVAVLRSTLPHETEGRVVKQFYEASYRPGEIDDKPVNGEMTLFIKLEPN